MLNVAAKGLVAQRIGVRRIVGSGFSITRGVKNAASPTAVNVAK